MKKCILLCLFAPLLFIACSDDDYVYPNVLTEMIDLVTDNTGTATYLKSDEGVIWSIQPRAGPGRFDPRQRLPYCYHVCPCQYFPAVIIGSHPV